MRVVYDTALVERERERVCVCVCVCACKCVCVPHSRQAAFHSLCNLPRYLAMSSDMVRVDLEAEQTSPKVRELLAAHALREGKSNARSVAVLAVVATYKVNSLYLSPWLALSLWLSDSLSLSLPPSPAPPSVSLW